MLNKEQRMTEAAMRYLMQIERGQIVSIPEFVATADADLRDELEPYLELTLAIGRSGHSHWFRSRKRNVLQLAPWERRAFLVAASCLPNDEYDHWYKSIRRQLDELDRAVVDWAKANPFS